ncbi:MAG: nucleotidyltransferase family protein [Bacteriovorax sp.]|nr:nucleotidyltransferase family protein [Bacteriovorax sp.]
MSKIKVSSILLCAGKSIRTSPENKLLLNILDKSVLKRTVEELLSSHFHEVIAVIGHHRDPIEQELKGLRVKMVHNKYFERGFHSSIKAGIMNIDLDSDYFAVCLADQPMLKKKDYNRLIAAAKSSSEALIIIPTCQGRRGNPVFISSLLIPEILDHPDSDRGCSYLFEHYTKEILSVEMDSDACLFDIDTPELFKQAKNKIETEILR